MAQIVRDTSSFEERLASYRASVESLLREMHTLAVANVMGDQAASKEVLACLANGLRLRRDREFLAKWIATIGAGEPARTEKCVGLVGKFVPTSWASVQGGELNLFFESLLGVAVMPVNPALREFYYAGVYHPLVSREYRQAIMDSVFVPVDEGSVGYAHQSGKEVHVVPDSIRELRGRVSLEDLIGGNISIVMIDLSSPPDSDVAPDRQQSRDKTAAILFFFLPVSGFFRDTRPLTLLQQHLLRVAKDHASGLRYCLKCADAEEEKTRISEFLGVVRDAVADDAVKPATAAGRSHYDLVRSILPTRPEHDPLGAAFAACFRQRQGTVEPLALIASRRHLEEHLFRNAARNQRFEDFVRNAAWSSYRKLQRRESSGTRSGAVPPLARHRIPGVAAASAESQSGLDLCFGQVIAPRRLQRRTPGGIPGFLIVHTDAGVSAQPEDSLRAVIPSSDLETIFSPLAALATASRFKRRQLANAAARLSESASGGAAQAHARRRYGVFERAAADLKLLSEAQESYLLLLAGALARGLPPYLANRTETYVDTLLALLRVRGLVGSGARSPRDPHRGVQVTGNAIISAIGAIRCAVLLALGDSGRVLVGVSAYRIGEDRACLLRCDRRASSLAPSMSRTTESTSQEWSTVCEEVSRRLAAEGEVSRLARVVALLELLSQAAGNAIGAQVVVSLLTPAEDTTSIAEDVSKLRKTSNGESDASGLLRRFGYTGTLINALEGPGRMGRAVLRLLGTTNTERTTRMTRTRVELDAAETMTWDMEWVSGWLTIPAGLALDDEGIQQVLNREAGLAPGRNEPIGKQPVPKSIRPTAALATTDTALARTVRRLVDLESEDDMRLESVDVLSGEQEHFVVGFKEKRAEHSLYVLEALGAFRKSVLRQSEAVVQRTSARIGEGTMHHLGNFAAQISMFSHVLSKLLAGGPLTDLRLKQSSALARLLGDSASRLHFFRDAAFASLREPPRGSSTQMYSRIPLGGALLDVIRYRYLELASFVELLRLQECADPGYSDSFVELLLASLTGCDYVEGGSPDEAKMRQRSVGLDLGMPETPEKLTLDDYISHFGLIYVTLQIKGAELLVPKPVCELALDELIHNAFKRTMQAHWKNPEIGFRIEIEATPESLELRNPCLGREPALADLRLSGSEQIGLGAMRLMLERYGISGPTLRRLDQGGDEIGTASVAVTWSRR